MHPYSLTALGQESALTWYRNMRACNSAAILIPLFFPRTQRIAGTDGLMPPHLERRWLSLKLAVRAAKAPRNVASTAWQRQRNTSCLQFNLAAGCRRQITSAQSMLGDKSSEKRAGAPVAPFASVMRHQLVLLLRMVLPQTSHLVGKRRDDAQGREGERCVPSDSDIKPNWLHTNEKTCASKSEGGDCKIWKICWNIYNVQVISKKENNLPCCYARSHTYAINVLVRMYVYVWEFEYVCKVASHWLLALCCGQYSWYHERRVTLYDIWKRTLWNCLLFGTRWATLTE